MTGIKNQTLDDESPERTRIDYLSGHSIELTRLQTVTKAEIELHGCSFRDKKEVGAGIQSIGAALIRG